MSEGLKAIIHDTKIVKNNHPGEGLEVPKVTGHDILFKAKDGSYHQTPEGLEAANKEHFKHCYKKK